MQSSRIAVRASRQVRINTPTLRSNARRFAEARSQPSRPGQPDVSGASSGGSSSSGSGSAGASHGLAYGLAGGFVGSAVFFYAWYQISGVGKAARTMKSMKQYVDSGIDKLKVEFKENTPEPNEAIDTLKRTAQSYATFIPGGRDWVDAIFKDIDIVRHNHAQEVDEIAKNAYEELRDTTKKGLNMETASQAWEVMSKYIQQLASLAVDAGQDILNNHPDLKNKLGGSFDQLKQMGDTLGPEAKKQVEETYQEIKSVINQGLTFDTVPKIQKLTQDKVQALRQLGDQAWQKGYEQVKPMLSNNPKIKEVVEQNIDTLKNGNVMEALEKVRQSLSSGDSSSLEQYIQAAKKKGEQYTSGNFSNWFSTIPSGSHILEQLQKLKQGAESQAPEAEKVARDTFNDIKAVLEKRSKQIEEVYENAKKEGGAK